jgi:hypothetical protein
MYKHLMALVSAVCLSYVGVDRPASCLWAVRFGMVTYLVVAAGLHALVLKFNQVCVGGVCWWCVCVGPVLLLCHTQIQIWINMT